MNGASLFGPSAVGKPKLEVQEQILKELRWHTCAHAINLLALILATAMVFTVLMYINNSETMADARDATHNVKTITSNMVPVSEVTRRAALDDTPTNVTLAQAATDALSGVGHADWNSVLGNATIVMDAIANVNYSAVTGLFAQAQEPETQAVIRRQIDHAFSSFDFATRGVTNIFTIFRDGIIAENTQNTQEQ